MTRRLSIFLLALVVGCGPKPPATVPDMPAPTPQPLTADGLHNLYRVSDRVYSGSSPDGDAGFASLQALGVKTVISVDGAIPDATAAGRHGLRYVHLPIGYDGIPSERATLLAKAVRDLPGPVYVHCHHGKHRGPAACAVIQLTLDPAWTPEQAEGWLKAAGTDPKYTGLTAIPHQYRPPSKSALDSATADFPTVATVPDLVRLMVDVDARWVHLKEIKAAGWKSPKDHPDLDPPHEAVILAELYREAARHADSTARGKEFVALLGEGEAAAKELEAALRKGDTSAAGSAFSRSQAACAKCHEKHRDKK
jgi:protein tyrosine phosphatase (PTP) superfamily phosphohydrolase (DUF442 family)